MAINPLELIIIAGLVLVVVFLGPKKIPELARSLGLAKKELQNAASGTGAQPTEQASADNLMEAARKLGISTEGKTAEQISAEIVRKTAHS